MTVPLWRQLARGLRSLARSSAVDRDVHDEVDHFFEQTVSELTAKGHSPSAARRLAKAQLGSLRAVREEVRSSGWEHALDVFFADVRYAMRRLRQDPGFTAVVVMTLALGIGASTTIFSAVNSILFESLPYPEADRIVMIWYATPDGARANQAFATYREVQARAQSLEAVAVFKPWQRALSGNAEPERLDGQLVSAEFFRVFGVVPQVGHDFDATDDRPGGAKVVVLSDALWRRRFGADRAVVGRDISLNDTPYTVIGVLPRGFQSAVSPTAEIWSLLQYDPSLPAQGREFGHHLQMIGRVRSSTSVAAARDELTRIAGAPVPAFVRPPVVSMSRGLIVDELRADLTRSIRPALYAIFGAVLIVLIISSVNVANLLLGRGVRRRHEFAIRSALGAARGRIIRQLLTESVLLAFVGGVSGVALALVLVRALVSVRPPDLATVTGIGVNSSVLVFSLVITSVVGLTVGLLPALRAARDLKTEWRHDPARTSTHHAGRASLVVFEMAMAAVLLVGGGLLLRSVLHVFAIQPGFDPSNAVAMQVQITSPTRYPDAAAFARFHADTLDAVRKVGGVAGVAYTSDLPLSGDDPTANTFGVQVEALSHREIDRVDATRYAVTPDYFAVMGIAVRRGRSFGSSDMQPAPVRPVIVSESFARSAFGEDDPIGKRIRLGGPPNRPWDVVVGVVGDVKQTSLATADARAVYVISAQWLWADTPMWMVVRARTDAAALAPAIKQAIWTVDKDQPIVRVETLENVVASSEAQRRFVLTVFEAFGIVALVLAAIGIYGVLSSSVAERKREIGVRSALGASRGEILALIIRQGLRLALAGLGIGLVIAMVASRGVKTFVFGVSLLDPLTYVSVVAILIAVSCVASWIPASRASRVDPLIALRMG